MPDADGAVTRTWTLLVYADQAYRVDAGRVSTGRAFIRFVTSMPPRVAEVVILGRCDPAPGSAAYRVDGPGVRFVALPYYRSVRSLGRLIGVARESCRTFSENARSADAVWIFGPHPLAVVFALIAWRRRIPLALGVRQDYVAYIRNRLPSRRWRWAVIAAWALDRVFRVIALRAPTVALGDEIARGYRHGAPVLATGFSLVSDEDRVPVEVALARQWGPTVRLLSVGRLDPEKNPLLLVEILARLRATGIDYRLTVAGDGPLRDDLARRARERGVADAVRLLGEVPNGPPLWDLYRNADIFIHVSLTEGLPQVIFEAQAAAIPIVATDVGGVRAALGGGETGILIPPDDPQAAVDAVRRLRDDHDLRARLVRAGAAAVAGQTIERQLDRVAAFFAAHLRRRAR